MSFFMNISDDNTFSCDTSILRYQNVFIADTVKTSYTTPFLYVLKNVEESSKKYLITDSSGTNISASKRGKLNDVMHDNHGKQIHGVAIGGYVNMIQSEFNFSVFPK